MRIILLLFCFLASFLPIHGQDVSGQWNGELEIPGVQLRVVLHVNPVGEGFEATLDSPDQGVTGIPVTSISYEENTLQFAITNIDAAYEGTMGEGEVIVGIFRQRGQAIPLSFSREPIEKKSVARPQEPAKPYPYYTEEVTFENPEASISLAGTLTLPSKEGVFPTVILITGSGPQNRDEEILGHKPFLVLADHLTRNGIGVLRYDDRGIGQSSGDFRAATTADFAKDVESAIDYLQTRREIDHKRIGLVGHSEGASVAAMVAARSQDPAFVVMLGGPAIPGYEILLMQNKLIREASGLAGGQVLDELALLKGGLDIVVAEDDMDQIRIKVQDYLNAALDKNPALVPNGLTREAFIAAAVGQYATPWFKYFVSHNPANDLAQVRIPVLALIGEKDIQVPADVNLAATEESLKKAGNGDFITKKMPGLNHLFQECQRGTPDEYAAIEQTFSPEALSEISRWVLEQTQD